MSSWNNQDLITFLSNEEYQKSQLKTIAKYFTDWKFDGVTLDFGGMLGTHPNTDSYLFTLAKWLKKIFEQEAKEEKWTPLGVAFTIFINPSTNHNPLKGIHLNTWDDYAQFIDYLFIMGYETASSQDYTGISPMNWLIEMLTPVFTRID